jgi:hypothetical protein
MNNLIFAMLLLVVTNAHAFDNAATKVSIISVVNEDDTTLVYRGMRYGYDYQLSIWRVGGVGLSAYLKSWFCDRSTNECHETNGYPLLDIKQGVVYTMPVNRLVVRFRVDAWLNSDQTFNCNFSSE